MFSRWRKKKKEEPKSEPSDFALSYMYDKGKEDGQRELIEVLNKQLTIIMTDDYEGNNRKYSKLDVAYLIREAKPIKSKQ